MSKALWTYEQPPGGEETWGWRSTSSTPRRQAGRQSDVGAPPGRCALPRRRPGLTAAGPRSPRGALAGGGRRRPRCAGSDLRLSPTELDRVEELDPARGVEPPAGSGPTGAAPSIDPASPSTLLRTRQRRGARPRRQAGALRRRSGLGLVAVLSFLAVVALLSAGGDGLAVFFLVPVLLGAFSLSSRVPALAPPVRRAAEGVRDPRGA